MNAARWAGQPMLEGLNLVGLKRRNFDRDTVSTLRSAYRQLFAEEGTFQERIDDTASAYGASAAMRERTFPGCSACICSTNASTTAPRAGSPSTVQPQVHVPV